MEERRFDARQRRVSTKADGSDLEQNSARRTDRAALELSMETRRKSLQEFRTEQAVRRGRWQSRLERRALHVEEEAERRQARRVYL